MRTLLFGLCLAAALGCYKHDGEHETQAVHEEAERRAATDTATTASKDLPSQHNPAAATQARERVELMEYEIRMPDTLTVGHHVFDVVNSGKVTHSIGIEGNGIDVRLPADLPRGDTATLEVDLITPGTYTVYCPIDAHKGKGMSKQVTVR